MKNKRENGEVVVEASIVVTLVVIVISIMFYIGMVFYQQTALSVVANRTATNIAQVYSNTLRDPFTGYVNPDSAYQSVTYGNMKSDAYVEALKDKATVFANYRLKKTQIIPSFDREVDVKVINKPNEVLKSQIIVDITDSYNVGLLGFFGVDGNITFSASGRADCVDYLEYLYGVEAISEPNDSPITNDSFPDPTLNTCIVTFLRDEYSGQFHAAEPVEREKSIITSNYYTKSKMPENPVFNNMQFKGWFTEDGRPFSASYQVNEDMTVYGNWDCTITFDPTGGTVNPTSKTVEYNKPTTLPTPTKSGFSFQGWFTKAEYSKEYKFNNGTGTQYYSESTPIPGNITLYARWKCEHAEYTSKQISIGNCKTPSRWLFDCKTCDHTYEDDGELGPCEAGDKEFKVARTCTKSDAYVLKCKHCNKTMLDENGKEMGGVEPPLGHCYANGKSGPFDTPIPDKPATCEEGGYNNASKCSRCNLVQKNSLPKLGHKWDDGRETKAPTCYSKGVKTYYCKNSGCSKTKTEDIEKTAHVYSNSPVETKSATCKTKAKGYYPCKNASNGCPATKPYEGAKAEHSYNGRCGETHTLRDKLSSSNNGCAENNLKKFQCVVCEWCGEYKKATNGEYNKKRMLSNGQKMTIKGQKYCVTCLYEVWPTDNPEWVDAFWSMPVQEPKENGKIDNSHPKGN